MKKLIVVLGMLAIVGMGMAEDFLQGEAKGADSPGAMMVGSIGNQSNDVMGMLGAKGVELSGTDPAIFDMPFFAKDGWVTDGGSYGRTPSQMAFLQDKTGENLRYSPKPGDW